MSEQKLTHLNNKGEARMVDIGEKGESERVAVASAVVSVSKELFDLLKESGLKKGDAISVARIAGIQAAKKTGELIPLCHSLPLTSVTVDIELDQSTTEVKIQTEARTTYKTGVEMEALTAASVAALTIYDMGKAVDRGIIIRFIRLESKRGGKSGVWQRQD